LDSSGIVNDAPLSSVVNRVRMFHLAALIWREPEGLAQRRMLCPLAQLFQRRVGLRQTTPLPDTSVVWILRRCHRARLPSEHEPGPARRGDGSPEWRMTMSTAVEEIAELEQQRVNAFNEGNLMHRLGAGQAGTS
jgi:hypothetical protein